MPTSRACTWASTPVSAQRVSHRRRVEPLACAAVAVRLRQGVPSRRKRRKVRSTRTVSVGGWPRPPSRGGSQTSMTVASRRKILTSKAISYVWCARHRDRHHGPLCHAAIKGSCENRLLEAQRRFSCAPAWTGASCCGDVLTTRGTPMDRRTFLLGLLSG